jgi:Domain of unknown function (DUF4032)
MSFSSIDVFDSGFSLPPQISAAGNIRFFIPGDVHPILARFPWRFPLGEWKGIRFLHVRSGVSRHVVRFVARQEQKFAIKETSFDAACREYRTYRHLRSIGIPTLRPLGVVLRDDGGVAVSTAIGSQVQDRQTGFLVSDLMENVIPDSILLRRGFSRVNRNRIWDAVIRLFVQLHTHGVYWGDASLANMLIQFSKEIVPQLGSRTVLTAVLADAETVEIHPSITESLRQADLEFFLESMLWTEADLIASGLARDQMMTQEDQQYLLTGYRSLFDVEQEIRWFELVTRIDVDRLLGNFYAKGYGTLLLKHVQEHKWYLSERQREEVSLTDAAEDWYREVFKPVCRIFQQYGLLEMYPAMTASSLYVEIMEHKYLMSERERKDVGLLRATQSYVGLQSGHPRTPALMTMITDALDTLFRGKFQGVLYLA